MEGALGSRCSLVVGERVVSRCDDGALQGEYALFEPDDVIVTAQLGFGAREQGYLTTAGLARDRLRSLGINSILAGDTFAAFRAAHLRTLARAPCVVQVIDQLTATETFEGGRYVAESRAYAGTWLDLQMLARACPLTSAPQVIQALHVLLVLEEVPEDVPVRLLTADLTLDKRPGSRTWTKVRFEGAPRLPWVLRAMRIAPTKPPLLTREDEDRLRESLVNGLRARATASAVARVRLRALAAQMTPTNETPAYGSPPIESLESATAALRHTPQPRAKAAALRDVQSASIPPPPSFASSPPSPPVPGPTTPAHEDALRLFEELRSHTELLRGEAHLRDVAKFLSAMADRSANVPELAILAARAWLASGETGHARHLAKELVAAMDTPEDVRLMAFEILRSTAPTNESGQPPPVDVIKPSPIVMLASEPDREVPAGASFPPFAEGSAAPVTEHHAVVVMPDRPPDEPVGHAPRPRVPFQVGRAEIAESLALPPGMTEEMLPDGTWPANATLVRIAMIRQARTLGRDYRLWYGTTLRTNAMAIEAMQRHLRRRFADAKGNEKSVQKLGVELTRHGALLSEILARALGGRWTDVTSEEPGRWAMMIGESLRVWPIGRVYRFFRQGHREADLVAFYLDLEESLTEGAK